MAAPSRELVLVIEACVLADLARDEVGVHVRPPDAHARVAAWSSEHPSVRLAVEGLTRLGAARAYMSRWLMETRGVVVV